MIRAASTGDVEDLVQLIHDLAEYERSPGSVEITADALRGALFGPSPTVFAHVAEVDGRVAGMAIWFLTFSTWTGRNGIHLEDLYVRPEARATGVGRALLTELATIAVGSGYARVEWSVLDWNEPALRFYRSLGAEPLDEWIGYRLSGPALATLGTGTPPAAG
jgi:GNAT superfamily N-acetyltransferase